MALMDTMTNVVGVLTIVLVMVAISLARSASRVISDLPPVTEEQLREAKAKMERLKAEEEQKKDKPKLTPAQLAAIDEELFRLESTTKDSAIKLFDLAALTQELAKREVELKQKKTDADALMAELNKLKERLDTTPGFKPTTAKVIHLPSSRPIPEGAKVEYMIATKDGVYWLDLEGAKEAFIKELKSVPVQQIKHERVKKGKEMVLTYDSKMLARYFEKRKLTYNDFQLKVSMVPSTPSPYVQMVPRERPSPSGMLAVLKHVKENAKTVVMFRVTADGFENYIATRERFDRLDVPAGWEFVAVPDFPFVVGEILTNQPPPPPAPPPPPGPPPENVIKPPAAKLD